MRKSPELLGNFKKLETPHSTFLSRYYSEPEDNKSEKFIVKIKGAFWIQSKDYREKRPKIVAKVELFTADGLLQKTKTNEVEDSGFLVKFDHGNTPKLFIDTTPDLSIIKFTVKDKNNNKLLVQTSLPMSKLRRPVTGNEVSGFLTG